MTSTLPGVHKDVRRDADILIDAGWTLHGHRLLPPPGSDERPITLPSNSKSGPSHSLRAAVRRALVPPPTARDIFHATIDIPPAALRAAGAEVELDEVVERGAAKRAATPPPEPEPAPERVIVSTQPWMARQVSGKRGGTVYPSPAVVERHWSDGTIDYACSEPGCGYTAPNPRSVAAHHGYHNRGKAWTPPTETAIDPTYTEPLTHRGYSPTDRMVALVAEQVRLALAAGMGPDEMAAAILAWFHDRPDLPDPGPAEPLTDAQVLDRIRCLVSAPTAEALADTQAALADAQADVARLTETATEMSDALDRMRAQRDRLAEERQALRDLLS